MSHGRIVKNVLAGNTSEPVPLNYSKNNYQASIFVDLLAGASTTYTVEVTADDTQSQDYVPANGNWQPHSALAALAMSSKGHLDFPATALRLVTTGGSGTVRLVVLEGGSDGGIR